MQALRLSRRQMIGFAIALLAVALPPAAIAQAYPAKSIRMIVPFPPGGSADTVARLVTAKMSESMKQSVVVDNRPGADTIIAMEQVAKAAPDGYTIGYAIGSSMTMNPTLYAKLPYDAAKDFVPVTHIANVPLALVVHPSVPAKTAKELAEYARANPNKLFYSQANIIAKVATEAYLLASGGKMVEVAYKGSAPSVQDLITGTVQVSVEPVATVLPYTQAGKLRALAITGSKRSPVFPDLPTIAETGVPGFAFDNWHAIVVPAGTPKDIVAKLHEEIVKAAKNPDVTSRLAAIGVEIVASTPEELAKRIATERDYWSKQIKTLGIKVE